MNLNLINDVKEIIKKNTEEINKTGKGFNLISILGMETNERYTHSNIIAELLNSKGSHTFGNRFFKLFLDELNITDFSCSNYDVITEEYMGSIKCNDGTFLRTFLDIVIRDKNTGKVILIENKIWADDQPFQIERYYEAYKGNISKLYYLNVNEWNDCPTTEPEIIKVFENISYKKHIKNWLANCIVASSKKPFINNQIEVYYQTILKLSNQNIYKKMNEEIENKITESLENFETVQEIAKYFQEIKKMKEDEFWEKLQKQISPGNIEYLDKNIHYKINKDTSDFIFLDFRLLNKDEINGNNINDEELILILTRIFGKKMNKNILGWVNSIDINNVGELFNLCNDIDLVVEQTKLNFESKIKQVKEAVNQMNILQK